MITATNTNYFDHRRCGGHKSVISCIVLVVALLITFFGGCGMFSDSEPGAAVAPASVIETNTCPDTHKDNYNISRSRPVTLADSILSFSVIYGGGCESHEFILKYKREESSLIVSVCHNAHGDACKAQIEMNLKFDLAQALSKTGTKTVILETEDGTRLPVQ